MQALTQCWFTRLHRPRRLIEHDEDGSRLSQCRYCERRIVSWDGEVWHPADGFNVSRLAEMASGRSLALVDVTEELVIHRFAVSHLNDEAAIEAFKRQLAEQFALDEPGSPLRLFDSARHAPRAQPQSRSSRRVAPDSLRSA